MSLPPVMAVSVPCTTDIPGVDSGCMDDAVPEALGQLDLDSLIGLNVPQARARVEEAGGDLLAIAIGEGINFDFRPRRVTVVIDQGRVVRVSPDLG